MDLLENSLNRPGGVAGTGQHVAYVMRSPPTGIATHAENRPRFEYERFCERTGAALMALTAQAHPASWAGRALRKRGVFGAAAHLLMHGRRRYDAYVMTGEDTGVPMGAMSLAMGSTAPIHIIFHGHYIGSAKFGVAIRALRRARHVHWHPLSGALREALVSRYGVRESQCHATGYAVDTEFFVPRAEAETVIVSAGTAYRDYNTLEAAASGLGIAIKIAADSTWFPEPVDLGATGTQAGVEVKSYGNYTNLRELYASAKFVVVPLRDREHASGYAVIAEAMAMGKAVIATRTQAPSDFVIDGETGFLVPPGDAAAMRARMTQLLDSPALAAELGARARRRMLGFSLDSFVDRLATAIEASCPADLAVAV